MVPELHKAKPVKPGRDFLIWSLGGWLVFPFEATYELSSSIYPIYSPLYEDFGWTNHNKSLYIDI